MATRNDSTDFFDTGLDIRRFDWGFVYEGTRAEILSTGIISPDLLPKKPASFEIFHNGHYIHGGRLGFARDRRWELFVHHPRSDSCAKKFAPKLRLIQGGKPTAA